MAAPDRRPILRLLRTERQSGREPVLPPVRDWLAQYDDLETTSHRERAPPSEFEAIADSEPVEAGWVVLCLAFDDDGRVLLIKQPWADGWLAPGGATTPGEALPETATREVEEETGVVVSPTRPHWLHEVTIEHAETGATTGWRNVYVGARAAQPTIRADLGTDEEPVAAADWFEALPDHLYNPDLLPALYERVRAQVCEQ